MFLVNIHKERKVLAEKCSRDTPSIIEVSRLGRLCCTPIMRVNCWAKKCSRDTPSIFVVSRLGRLFCTSN